MSTLTLSIINLDQVPHNVTVRCQFDAAGGTIGSRGADWLINDRQHSIAPIHCEIRWVENSFCVIDRCERTYLNDSSTYVGAYPPRRLREGDQLHIGGYRMSVQCSDADTRSLQDLFNPEYRLLDQWMADTHTEAWQPEACSSRALPEICSVFEPVIGNDPLAALDAVDAAEPSRGDLLQRLLAGERP
ncbi:MULTISPECIES: FHA domain-containing protein [Pseudomonas]|uniref:FHA domain-containing protein n=1 Tax=Pseudomonas TaxID=286 RepID=UPI002DBF0738|nr:FHA domain-containing protein [Pseudomonas asiatica]MEB6587542.1 FHA domain-containing protein [Pseudomonas asiatica]